MSGSPANKSAPPLPGLTIDPPGAHDLDDALWLHGDVLTVYIPDMCEIVPRHAPIEVTARERGFTRYFARGNAPMLPRALAEDRLSLLPEKYRRVFAIHIVLDSALDVADMQVKRGILRSHAQLTYADVPAILSDPAHALATYQPMLARLAEIAANLLRKRRQRGELAFYDLRQALTVTEEGQLRSLKTDETNVGYVLVQEMMLLANRAIAEWLLASEIPALYRNHRVSVAAPAREALLSDIEQMLTHPQFFDMQTARQRLQLLMGRARYSPAVEGHYGLNLPCYMHVTSPLRRYADLVNNRIIGELVDARQEKRAPNALYAREELIEIGDHLHVLVLELEQRRENHFKAQAENKARVQMSEAAPALAELSPADFERVLKISVGEESPPPAVLETLRLHMQQQSVRERELFLALFETPAQNPAWDSLRQELLAYLVTHTPLAVSLLAMGENVLSWAETEYQQAQAGMHFVCVAALTSPEGLLETPAYYAQSKKAAQQASAVALCHLLLAAAPPDKIGKRDSQAQAAMPAVEVVDASAEVVEPSLSYPAEENVNKLPTAECSGAVAVEEDAEATEAAKDALVASVGNLPPAQPVAATNTPFDLLQSVQAAPAFDWNWARSEINAGNWIAVLNNACARTHQRKPTLLFSVRKDAGKKGLSNLEEEPQENAANEHGSRNWQCAAKLIWNKATFTAEALASTKQAARTEVCKQLVMAMQKADAREQK